MDPPIKLFGQTIAKVSSPVFREGEDAEAVQTSSGVWNDGPSVSTQEFKNDGSCGDDISGSGLVCSRQDSKSGSLPDLLSSASNSADEEKLSLSPGGGTGTGGCASGDDNRSVHLLRSASQGDRAEEENSEDDDGCLVNGRSKKDTGENEGSKTGEKMPRRPEGAVACPRCHSLETKFCYYNNYNVNQPRHFCKHCQRYWTAGGTLRNVPVGAGRRKNKHGSSIGARGQVAEMGTVRGDGPDVASPLIVTKGVVPVPIQVSVVQGKAGVMRVAVPASSDPSVLPFLRMQSQQLDPSSICMTSPEPLTSSEVGNMPCKRSRLSTPVYSDASTGLSDLDQQQSQGWGQQSKDESPLTPTSSNIMMHEIKGEMIGVAATPVVVGGPDQPQSNSGHGAWSGAGPQAATVAPGGATAAAAPFGFFNGAWPFGYNVGVGWTGAPTFCAAGGVPAAGTPGVPGPPPPGNITAAWSGTTGGLWTGVPWPMPGLAWGPPWAMAPWAMSASPGGVSIGSMTQRIPISSAAAAGLQAGSTPAVAAATVSLPSSPPPSSSLGKHSRRGLPVATAAPVPPASSRGKLEGTVWAPKSLRMADPEEAIRSSVWRILGSGTRPEMATGSTFKAFQPLSDGKKISDDEQQAAQASLHANPAAMSRSMNFHESN